MGTGLFIIRLTTWEIQVAAPVKEGLTIKEIAGCLNISAHAVDFQRTVASA
jgi:DNA-binding NarL/FixJ family response regulator